MAGGNYYVTPILAPVQPRIPTTRSNILVQVG